MAQDLLGKRMEARMRQRTANARCKPEQVRAIRRARATKTKSLAELSEEYDLSEATIRDIAKGKTYFWVTDGPEEAEKGPLLEEVPESTPESVAKHQEAFARFRALGLLPPEPDEVKQQGVETPEEIARRVAEEADQRDAVALAVGTGKVL